MELVKLEDLETVEEEIIHKIKEQPKTLVIDSSVFIKWFSKDNEEDLDNALSILNSLIDNNIVIACPELAIYELANVLYFKPGFEIKKTKTAIEKFLDLGIEFIRLYKKLILIANEIRYDLGITFYDSSYIAVAKFFNLRFITADKKLFEACQKLYYVELLKNSKF